MSDSGTPASLIALIVFVVLIAFLSAAARQFQFVVFTMNFIDTISGFTETLPEPETVIERTGVSSLAGRLIIHDEKRAAPNPIKRIDLTNLFIESI